MVLLFDLTGTLLDLSHLDPLFVEHFGSVKVRQQWFSQVLKLALTLSVVGEYRPFSEITRAALEAIQQHENVKLSSNAEQSILGSLRKLPAYADVAPALSRLKSHGFRMAVLTNSGLQSATEAISNAGLQTLFEEILSADSAAALKPRPEPYKMAADRLGVKMQDILMVAAHSWDIAGARAAGCNTAFLKRPQQTFESIFNQPTFMIDDLEALADELVKSYKVA